MRKLLIASVLLSNIACAANDIDITIPLPKETADTSPSTVKYENNGEKVLIGFIGKEVRYAVSYDIAQKKVEKTCMSNIFGELTWISGNGKQFAIRNSVNKTGQYIYEIRSTKNCNIELKFTQPSIQYPELTPLVAFSTELDRAVLVERKNPYSSGKAFMPNERDVKKFGFATEYGQVHVIKLSDGSAVKRFPTPSDETQLFLSDDGEKFVLMQLKEKSRMRVFAVRTGNEIKEKKGSDLFYLKDQAKDSWQFWVNYFTFPEFYRISDKDTPEVDEERKQITFHTKLGSKDVSNFETLPALKFWFSAADGKYIVVSGMSSNKYYVKIYAVQ
jgi:hypothetical protein